MHDHIMTRQSLTEPRHSRCRPKENLAFVIGASCCASAITSYDSFTRPASEATTLLHPHWKERKGSVGARSIQRVLTGFGDVAVAGTKKPAHVGDFGVRPYATS